MSGYRKKQERKRRRARRKLERAMEQAGERDALTRRRSRKRRMLAGPGVPVSDHAVLRYLERVAGLDLEAVRRRIYTERVAEAAETLGHCRLHHDDGCVVVVSEGVVVTVLEA